MAKTAMKVKQNSLQENIHVARSVVDHMHTLENMVFAEYVSENLLTMVIFLE